MVASLDEMLAGLKAAAEPTRLRLLAICAEGELTVSEITRILGQSQPRVSRHLKLLCDAGMLIRFREQHWVLYRVPARGAGTELVRTLLELLPVEDEILALDRQRMEQLKAERARLAADYLRANTEDWLPRDADVNEAEIDAAILEELGTRRIGDLLDIGTGTGRMLELLGRHAESAIGVDISAEMLMVARTKLHAAGLKEVMVRHGDMYSLPFPDATFDTVTIDHVLYEAEHPATVIGEAARLLRARGRLLIVDFARGRHDPLETEGALGGLSEDELSGWLHDAGLDSGRIRRLAGESLTILLAVASLPRQQDAAA